MGKSAKTPPSSAVEEPGEMQCSTLYLKHTMRDDHVYFSEHRVWDRKRFVVAQMEAARDAKQDAEVEQVSAEDYEEWRRATRAH